MKCCCIFCALINKQNGWTPLIVACFYGNLRTARLLIAKGVDINKAENVRSNDISTVFFFFLIFGLTYLQFGQTPLFKAQDRGHIDLMRLLLEEGADMDKADYVRIHDAYVYGTPNVYLLFFVNLPIVWRNPSHAFVYGPH